MKFNRLAHLFILLLVLSSCIGIQFGEEKGDDQQTVGTSSDSNGVIDPTAAESAATGEMITGDSVDLVPYFTLKINNPINANLSGITLNVEAGESLERFLWIDASALGESGLYVPLSSSITDNSVFVILKGSNGEIRERHVIPLPNCDFNISNCNKIVVQITQEKYQELVR